MPRRSRDLSHLGAALGVLSLVSAAACSDTPGDLPGATPLDCSGEVERRTLRIDRLEMPFGTYDREPYGADQDGDGTIDNSIASVFNSLPYLDPDIAADTAARLQRRVDVDTVWLIEVEHCDGRARVSLARGELRGTAVRVVEDGALAAAGTSEDRHVEAHDGVALMPLGAVFDLADTGFDEWHPTYPAWVQIDLGDGEASGSIGGALFRYDDAIARAVLPYLQAGLDAEDPKFLEVFDAGGDGALSLDELKANSLFQTFFSPDVDVGGDVLELPAIPPLDGELESYSFGFGFHAVDVDVE